MDRTGEHEMAEMQVESGNNAMENYNTAKPLFSLQETSNNQADQTRPFLVNGQKEDGPYRDSIHIADGDVTDIPLHTEQQRQKRRSMYLLSACLAWLFLITIIVSFQWTGRSPTPATTWLDGNEKRALVLSTITKTNVTWLSDIESE